MPEHYFYFYDVVCSIVYKMKKCIENILFYSYIIMFSMIFIVNIL